MPTSIVRRPTALVFCFIPDKADPIRRRARRNRLGWDFSSPSDPCVEMGLAVNRGLWFDENGFADDGDRRNSDDVSALRGTVNDRTSTTHPIISNRKTLFLVDNWLACFIIVVFSLGSFQWMSIILGPMSKDNFSEGCGLRPLTQTKTGSCTYGNQNPQHRSSLGSH